MRFVVLIATPHLGWKDHDGASAVGGEIIRNYPAHSSIDINMRVDRFKFLKVISQQNAIFHLIVKLLRVLQPSIELL